MLSLKKIVDRAATLERCKKDAEGKTRKVEVTLELFLEYSSGFVLIPRSSDTVFLPFVLSYFYQLPYAFSLIINYRLHLCT